jgi:glycosyltransferase involved in cell wall biosynthesis
MDVSIFVSGFFHLPLVCDALAAVGYNLNVHSSYPEYKLRHTLPDNCNICTYPKKELLNKIPNFIFKDKPSTLSRTFQGDIKKALQNLNSDVVVGWAGHSLATAKACNDRDIPLILERGSTHIQWQADCLRKAYACAGMRENAKMIPSNLYIENELEEYQRASAIHVPSAFCAETFNRYCGPEITKKIRITRYGFDIPNFRAELDYETTKKNIRVGFAGTLSVRKGFFDYCWLSNQLNSCAIEFFAVGNSDSDTKTIIRMFQPSFQPEPSLGKKQFLKTLAQWDVLVLPSYEEGLSMVIPEAITQQTIVIASDVSGAKEYINHGENGFIFKHGERAELKAILERLANEPDLKIQIRNNIRDNLLKKNTKNDYIEQYTQSVKSLTKTKGYHGKF